MTDAAELAKKVLSTTFDGDLALQTLLTNEFKRAQAEAIGHAADVIFDHLKRHAAALHPSMSIPAPSNEVEKMDKVLAEGVVKAGQRVEVDLATGQCKVMQIDHNTQCQ